jgi:hypothetical protein
MRDGAGPVVKGLEAWAEWLEAKADGEEDPSDPIERQAFVRWAGEALWLWRKTMTK